MSAIYANFKAAEDSREEKTEEDQILEMETKDKQAREKEARRRKVYPIVASADTNSFQNMKAVSVRDS